ncbi:carboxypeptidase D [Malassezia caprae]|uniref:Carboxypeptidase n=1 Tax=Malassezia caprae TaxID=1381934 RepID=A0AAF0E3L4_9BASI|nr:carboxypeptidase D [Malassezia caprae]
MRKTSFISVSAALAWAAQVAASFPSNATFPNASKYLVGKHLPGIPFEVPHSWAGLMPISGKKNESRELFFWLWAPSGDVGHDDITIWLNGGPGCSSLEGALSETGPILLPKSPKGVATPNPYSWTNLSHVLFVETPVGVGFTRGEPNIHNEYEHAKEFYGFLKQFFKTFKELQGKRLWLTGESYAGMYIPYMAHEIYNHPANASGINLKGIGINDPSFTTNFLGAEAPAYEFIKQNQHVIGLNDSAVSQIAHVAKKQGLLTYVQDHLHYPPRSHIHVPTQYSSERSVWEMANKLATSTNSCFSVYEIKPNCTLDYDSLGMPLNSQQASKKNFLNSHPELKKELNVNPHTVWKECTDQSVFANKKGVDQTLNPDRTVLPGVIEKNQRTVIQHGTWDFVLIANGSALAIQNMTWGGKTGFQSPPRAPIRFDDRVHGTIHEERGLTFALVDRAGHMIPQFKPKTAYKLQQYLLGQITKHNLTHPSS